jgi:hypothetical protein
MKPDEVFLNFDEIIDVLGRPTVIDLVCGGPDRFPGITAPLASTIKDLQANGSGVTYLESLQLELAAYHSLRRLILRGAFEPTSPPENISMERLRRSRGPGHA